MDFHDFFYYTIFSLMLKGADLRGLAIIGGEGPSPMQLKDIAKGIDIIVAADSGLIAAEAAGISPDWIVGDMDSLEDQPGAAEKLLSGYAPSKILRYPREKDYSDTELAINLLKEKGCKEITIAGGGGGRIDHLLAIYYLFGKDRQLLYWYTKREKIFSLLDGSSINISIKKESLVSVFPLNGESFKAESKGLKWELNSHFWERQSIGLSNIALTCEVFIHSVRGNFFIVTEINF